MLNKGKVAKAIWGNAKRQVRIALGLKPRPEVWPPHGFEFSLQHHIDLVNRFQRYIPGTWDVTGKTICEVGSHDCLAIASLLIAAGAARMEFVEPFPSPCLTKDQVAILNTIQKKGYKLDTSILRNGDDVSLDTARVSLQKCFMEDLPSGNLYDYVYSIDVLEHVEDLDGFYAACYKAMKPGGQMFHCIDFSGHGELEDPIPPLDHQTYPDWLYNLMYPPYHRQTRFFVGDHQRAILKAGFVIDETRVTRKADAAYLAAVWPRLRKAAQSIPQDEMAMLEAVIVSRKA